MANLKLLTLDAAGERKQKNSNAEIVDFLQIRIGASVLAISEDTGHFAFGAKKLTGVADPTANQDAATKFYVDSQTSNGANQQLSNLSGTIAVNLDLDPGADNARDMGNATFLWKDIFARKLTADVNQLVLDGSSISVSSKNISNVADPVSAQDAVTKAYVDNLLNGIKWKANVRVASTANLALSSMPASVDGVTLTIGDRFLAKDQTLGEENGIYVFNGAAAAATRAADADSASELQSASVFVAEGTSADIAFTQTADSITLGTTPLVFVAFSSTALSGHDMIALVGGNISVDLASNGGLESSNPGNAAGQLRIKLADTSLALGAGGINVNLATGSGLEVATGLKVKLEASNPSLQIVADEVGVKFDPAGALSKGAGGTKANVDADTIKIASNNLAVDHAKTKTNDNAGPITIRQVVYVKSNGNVDLAQANVAAIADGELGVVEDASISAAAAGKIIFRRGAIIGGFAGLTPGKKYFVSRGTAGAIVVDLTGFVAGEKVYSVGRALSATELVFDPQFEYEF